MANLSFDALAPHRIMGTAQASGEQCCSFHGANAPRRTEKKLNPSLASRAIRLHCRQKYWNSHMATAVPMLTGKIIPIPSVKALAIAARMQGKRKTSIT